MSDRKFETFTAKIDNKDTVFKVYAPGIDDYKEAAKVRNVAFMESLGSKAPLRAQVNTLLRSRGQWDDERENQYNQYTKELLDKDHILKKGGIKASEAKKIALSMKTTRNKLKDLLTDKSTLDNMTAEGQADNAHFNSLITTCLVYNNEHGEEIRYFKNIDDYLILGNSDIAFNAAQKLAGMLYTIGENADKMLPENQFLLKYKFVNDNLKLVDKQGRLIDEDGRLIDDKGRFINESGEYIDKFGNKVDKEGEYIVETTPFLEDDGSPITVE